MDQINPELPAFDAGGNTTAKLLDSLPMTVAVLDDEHQVIFGEEQMMTLIHQLGRPTGNRRLGDILSCVNAISAERGCMTSGACSLCGAYQAIQESRASGSPVTHECRIQYETSSHYGAIDAMVTATPYGGEDHSYTLLTLQDLSDEKRRESLERVFLHDLLNTAGGLSGLIQMMRKTDDPKTVSGFLADVERASAQLLDEIIAQRQLLWAETAELSVNEEDCECRDILETARESVLRHNVGLGRKIEIYSGSEVFNLRTDRVLLNRVLVNLQKNALEATRPPAVVTLGARRIGGHAIFSVHNPGVMSRDVQLQMFQRSFSTKGSGRGLGTYSVRLLTENYLGGSVDFTSGESTGTIFRCRLPASE